MSSDTYQLSSNNLLYFLHIPKTAGMTFTDFVKSHFAPSESNPDSIITGFLKTPPEELARYKFIGGHFYYNIDDFVKRKPVYITMLRDPVERTISHYSHIRRMPSHTAHEVVKSQSLLEFVRDPRSLPSYANLQTRYIGLNRNFPELVANVKKGLYQGDQLQEVLEADAPTGFFDHAILERAQERLSRFAFVGVTEQYDPGIELLCSVFGWPVPETSKVINYGTNRPSEQEISQDVLDVIHENTQLDAALYAMGKQLFEERYQKITAAHAEKASPPVDITQATIAALQQKIDLQQRAIRQLGEELTTIQNSFGWRFTLRMNKLRLKVIPHGSTREAIYLKLRGQ